MRQSKKCILILLFLCLVLLPSASSGEGNIAEAYGLDLDLYLSYLDFNGEEQNIFPAPAGADGETIVLWGLLPDPTVEEVTLHINDINGLYTFSPDEGADLQVIDAGETLQGTPLCEITALSMDGETVLIRVYLSQSVAEPLPEKENDSAAQQRGSVQIVVHFVDTDGRQIAPDRIETVWTGRLDVIYADTIDGYTRTGDVAKTIQLAPGTTEAEDITFVYTADEPEEIPPEPADAQISIEYLDEDGNRLADDTFMICPGGMTTEVIPEAGHVPENYVLTDEQPQSVFVDFDGPHPKTVSFHYAYQAPAEKKQIRVITEYVDRNGQPLAPAQEAFYAEGETVVITASPEGLDASVWVPDGETERVIVAADEGGQTQVVSFVYVSAVFGQSEAFPASGTEEPQQTPTPGAAPVVKLIQVIYSYENDIYGYSGSKSEPVSEGETLLFAEEPKPGYQLEGEDAQLVTVFPDGTTDPETVVFHYTRIPDQTKPPAVQTTISVYYLDESGMNVAAPTLETVYEGTQTIYANPTDLKDGYDLITGPQEVVCQADGTLIPDQLVFIYRSASVQEEPEADGMNDFSLQPYSGYARALRTVNLRSYPDQSDSTNIIATVTRDDLIVLEGITSYKSYTWFYVSVNGRKGYMAQSVIQELSDSEAAFIRSSGVRPEDGEPEQADGESGIIERWGKTRTSVKFRSSPGGSLIRSLKRNTEIFVLSSEEVDGVQWYTALSNGQTGYVMAEFIDLLNAEQSALKQSRLKTPVPTHTPMMTRVPTATPTMYIPTPTPTPAAEIITPAPTKTPEPYTGYGAAVFRAAVRSSLSLSEDAVREMIPVDTLVYVQGQTYVEGVCWDSVRVVSSGVTGFMEDSQIRRISEGEAEYYIAELTTPTPAPVIVSTPAPFTGTARTLGGYVPLRADMSSNARIIQLMEENSVLQVYEQATTAGGITWCLAQYGADIGYVRRDMIVQMNDWEIGGYIASLRTPTPTPFATATPLAGGQRITAYGIINKDKVNLRMEPNISSISLYMMSRNEMAYILHSVIDENEKIWYYVTISNRTGYVRADYLTILNQNELDDFLNTEEFRSANNSENPIHDSSSLYSYEDHLQQQWESASVTSSFEPFNPYETPAPAAAATPQPAQTPALTMPPTFEPTIVAGFKMEADENGASGGPSVIIPLLAAGAAVIIIGGAVILFRGFRRRKKRLQAMMRAQRTQQGRRGAYQDGEDGGTARQYSQYRNDSGASGYTKDPYEVPEVYKQYRPQRKPGPQLSDDTVRTEASGYRRTEASAARVRRGAGNDETGVWRGEDASAMFRRPVRPGAEKPPESSVSDNAGPGSDHAGSPFDDQAPPSAGGAPAVRRRRSERYHSDQDS